MDAEAQGSSPHVLLVDDDPDILAELHDGLAMLGIP